MVNKNTKTTQTPNSAETGSTHRNGPNSAETAPANYKLPLRILVVAVVLIFAVEIEVMVITDSLIMPEFDRIVIDSLLLISVLALVLYFLIFRPVNKIVTQCRQSEEEYHTILRTTLDGFWITDMEGRFLDANDAYCRMLEYSRAELLKMRIADVEAYESPAEIFGRIQILMERGSGRFEVHHRAKSGRILTLDLSINYLREPGRFFVFGHDITKRKQTEQELRDAYDKLNNSVKVLGRHNSEITLLAEMNTMLQASFTIDEAHRVIGQYLPRLYPDDSGAFYVFNSSRNLAETIVTWGKNVPEEPNFTPEECWAVRLGRPYLSKNTPDARAGCNHGKNISGVLFCVPMISQNEVSGVLALVFNPAEPGPQGHPVGDPDENIRLEQKKHMAVNIAGHVGPALANLKLREKLRNLSIRDHLTGLFNRRYMEESLERELFRAQRKGTPVGIVMMDIDQFKDFNDHFGHDRGDSLMQLMGQFLRDNIRESDIACRYGGEEFTLIMPEASLESARQRAELLRESFKKLPHQGQNGVTISLGVSAFPMHGQTAPEILKAADMALYRAKESGRDRVYAAPEPLHNKK